VNFVHDAARIIDLSLVEIKDMPQLKLVVSAEIQLVLTGLSQFCREYVVPDGRGFPVYGNRFSPERNSADAFCAPGTVVMVSDPRRDILNGTTFAVKMSRYNATPYTDRITLRELEDLISREILA
jgi:hypothetical protein